MLGRVFTRTEQLLLLALAVSIGLGGVSLYYHKRAAKPAAPAILPVVPPAAAAPAAVMPPPPATPSPVSEPAAIVPAAPLPPLAVSVVGAVNRPGLVRVPHDARVQDAITAAGGASDDSDVTDINLAALLIDGSTLAIPARASAQRGSGRLTARGGPTAAQLNPPQYTISGWNTGGTAALPAPAEMASHAAAKESAAPQTNDAPKLGPLDINTATAEELDALPGIGPKLAAEIVAYRAGAPFASVEDLTNVPGIGPRKLDAIRNLITVQGAGAMPPTAKPEEPAKPKRRSASRTSP